MLFNLHFEWQYISFVVVLILPSLNCFSFVFLDRRICAISMENIQLFYISWSNFGALKWLGIQTEGTLLRMCHYVCSNWPLSELVYCVTTALPWEYTWPLFMSRAWIHSKTSLLLQSWISLLPFLAFLFGKIPSEMLSVWLRWTECWFPKELWKLLWKEKSGMFCLIPKWVRRRITCSYRSIKTENLFTMIHALLCSFLMFLFRT